MTRARRIATLLLLCAVAGSAVASEPLPDQMIYGGLEGDPVADPRSAPVRFVADWMRLPDQRDAQVYRLSWWTKIGNAHAAEVALDYAGLKSGDSFRYGGGGNRIRWTSRVFPLRRHSIGLDFAGSLPLGDETLFPLSARAPMVMFRGRVVVARFGFVRLWAGWWARRVSPPSDENRQDPLSGFASGTGFDALMEWRTDRVDVDWMLHLPTGGPVHRVFHWTVDADWWVGRELALRTGFGLDTGPRSDRSFDWSVRVGATWRAASEE
jgi:hypothetical protein